MESTGKSDRAQRKARIVEWQVCEDERAWQMAHQQPAENSLQKVQMQRRTYQWLLRWGVPTMFMVLVAALFGAWWLGGIAQQGINEVETEVEAAVTAELWNRTWKPDPVEVTRQELSLLNRLRVSTNATDLVTNIATDLAPTVEMRAFGRNWAVVDMLIQPSAQGAAYRQTRIYQYSDRGWVRAKVSTEYLGRERQLESNYFIFRYHTIDEEAVKQTATRLDTLYPALYASFFAEPPTDEKVVILVDPEWTINALPPSTNPRNTLTVASPAVTLKPTDMAEGDLLLQSSMLALFAHLAEQASVRTNSLFDSAVVTNGMRLWLIWEHDLPLARWRDPLVQWVFRDVQVPVEATTSATALLIRDLCAQHALWMHSPLEIGVPVICAQSAEGEGLILAWRYQRRSVDFPLTWLLHRPSPPHDVNIWHSDISLNPYGASVGLAIVFEYIASAHGVERIPQLLAALPRHERVETLIAEVFHQSQEDFYAGWQAFMTERYGIMP